MLRRMTIASRSSATVRCVGVATTRAIRATWPIVCAARASTSWTWTPPRRSIRGRPRRSIPPRTIPKPTTSASPPARSSDATGRTRCAVTTVPAWTPTTISTRSYGGW